MLKHYNSVHKENQHQLKKRKRKKKVIYSISRQTSINIMKQTKKNFVDLFKKEFLGTDATIATCQSRVKLNAYLLNICICFRIIHKHISRKLQP